MTTVQRPFEDGSKFPITQPYGPTTFEGEPTGYYFIDQSIDYYSDGPGSKLIDHLHCGVDYGCPAATPIVAPKSGQVTFAGWDVTGFGNCVKISHGDITSLMGHLSKIGIGLGQKVGNRQEVGLSGSTGNSTGAHLHWSIIRNSDSHFVPPWMYLKPPDPTPPKPTDLSMVWVSFNGVSRQQQTGVRDGPSGHCNTVSMLDPHSKVQCVAYMHGQPRWDSVAERWDDRWFYLLNGGWVPSAVIDGNPPIQHAI